MVRVSISCISVIKATIGCCLNGHRVFTKEKTAALSNYSLY